MKKKLNLVWLKRDLRIQDHSSFLAAENAEEEYLILYIFEPSAIQYPDCSLRHLQFIYHSIEAMNKQLQAFGRAVIVFYGEALDVFQYLGNSYAIKNVFSYQESGIRNTWKRDQQVAKFLEQEAVVWTEFQRDGIVRGINNRTAWDQQWYAAINDHIIHNQYTVFCGEELVHPFSLDPSLEEKLKSYPENFQKPGEVYAWKYLSSFCQDRGRNYSRHISKPKESRRSCGRISPYLAWGNISIKQVFQFVSNHSNYLKHKRSFNGLLLRLHWHCHFIQKFEMECDYERFCINRGYETLEYTNHEKLIKAWQEGLTGLPLVDACMRCLKATGWINFRMRAMLVSVFCHHFDCDWRRGVYHLARLFLDYEPGIHYPQFQMQAGTTGINTVRMYNPIKQSQDHDPKGVFIKEWVSELRNVPVEFIHEPWKMTELDKKFNAIQIDYVLPLVDVVESGRKARAKIWGHRENSKVKEENKRILQRHVRKNGLRDRRD